MSPYFSRLISVVASFFIFSAAWFCLWSISLHLAGGPALAVLLFPFGLRLGLRLGLCLHVRVCVSGPPRGFSSAGRRCRGPRGAAPAGRRRN